MKKYLKTYSAFQRHILKEFLSKKELERIDILYNIAKIDRAIRCDLKKVNDALLNKIKKQKNNEKKNDRRTKNCDARSQRRTNV